MNKNIEQAAFEIWIEAKCPSGDVDQVHSQWINSHQYEKLLADEEFEALRKDAERYRWLRAQHWSYSTLAVVAEPQHALKLGHDLLSGDRLDAAIDAATAGAAAVG